MELKTIGCKWQLITLKYETKGKYKMKYIEYDKLRRQFANILNCNSAENDSDTPDYILADYLIECLKTYNRTIKAREEWYGKLEVKLEELEKSKKGLCL